MKNIYGLLEEFKEQLPESEGYPDYTAAGGARSFLMWVAAQGYRIELHYGT